MGQSDENVTVSGNSIYEVNPGTGSSLRGMDFGGSGTNFITGNSIHDLVTTGAPAPTGVDIAARPPLPSGSKHESPFMFELTKE